MSELLVQLAGIVFLLLGAVFVGGGFWINDMIVVLAGALTAVPGIVLLSFGLAERTPGEFES